MNCIKICGKEWTKVKDRSSGKYFVDKNITFKTLMLKPDLCDYSG